MQVKDVQPGQYVQIMYCGTPGINVYRISHRAPMIAESVTARKVDGTIVHLLGSNNCRVVDGWYAD